MSWIEALILGVIQGLTEFLPVSSSGHLEIASVLLGVETSDNLLMAVVLHLATALSTFLVFRKEITDLLFGVFKFKWNEETKFASRLVLSMIPVFVVGIFFEDEIEKLFTGNLLLVGGALVFTALLLFFTHFKRANSSDVSNASAFVIGIAQAIAILPGVSRSGATIATALLLGVEKTKATRFSFLMVLVPIIGASMLKAKDYFSGESEQVVIQTSVLLVGFFAAFITGYVACRWMLTIVRRGKLSWFAIYCLLVGIVAIASQIF